MSKTSVQIEHNKKVLLVALTKTMGVVTSACQKVKIGRTTFYEYYHADETFQKQVDEIQNVALDFAESQLFKRITKGSDAAVIFYLKTKGKKRGYIEKSEVEHSGGIAAPFNDEQLNKILNHFKPVR